MAFTTEENYLKGILTLLLMIIPSLATTNIDCNGMAFHCENSTHFKICVDLGGGVSSTIDDFVIPCPPTTFCLESNRYECEFPPEISSPFAANEGTTSIPETNTTLIADVTTLVPLDDYYNNLSTNTLPESFKSSTVKSVATIEPTQAAKINNNAIISTVTSSATESTLITVTDSYMTPTAVFEENKESLNTNDRTNTLITEPPLASTTAQIKGNVGYKGTDTYTTTLTSFTEDFYKSTEMSTNSEPTSALIDNSIQNSYISSTFATLATPTRELESGADNFSTTVGINSNIEITKKEMYDFLTDTEKVGKVQHILENSTDGKLILNENVFTTGSIDNIISSQLEPTTIKLYPIHDNKTEITILSTEPTLKVTEASITDSKQATVEKVSTNNVTSESTVNLSSHTENEAQSQQATLTTSLLSSKTPPSADNFSTTVGNNNKIEITPVSTEPTMQVTDALITDSEVATILTTVNDNVVFTSIVNASSHTGNEAQSQEETLYTTLPLSMTTNTSADIYSAKLRINNKIEITTASTEPIVKVTDGLITYSGLDIVENTLTDNVIFTSNVNSSPHTENAAQNQEEKLTTSLPLSVSTNTGADIYSTTIEINNKNKIKTVSTEPTMQVTDASITDSELATVLKTSTDNVDYTSTGNTSPYTGNEEQNQEETLYTTLPLSMTTNNTSANIYSAKLRTNNNIEITTASTEPTVKVTDDLITDSELDIVEKTLTDNVVFTSNVNSSPQTGNAAQNQEETLPSSSTLSVTTNTGEDIYSTTIGINNKNKITTAGTEPTVHLTDVLKADSKKALVEKDNVVSESTVYSSSHTENEAQSQHTSGADNFSTTVGINNNIEIMTVNTEATVQVTDDLLTDSEPATVLKTLTDKVFFTPTMTTDDTENIAQNQEETLDTSLPISKINNTGADIYSAKIRIKNTIETTTASTEPIVKITDALLTYSELPTVEKALTDNFVFTSTVSSSSHTGRVAQNQEEALTTSLPLSVSTNTDAYIYSRTIGISNKTETTADGTEPTVQLTDVLNSVTEPATEQITATITNAIENGVVFTSNVNSSSKTVAQNQETTLTTSAPLPDTTKDEFATIEGTTNHDHVVFTTNVNANSISRQIDKVTQNQLKTSSLSPEILETSVDTANKSIIDVDFTSHTNDSINTESSNTDSSTALVGVAADNVTVFSTSLSSHTEDIAQNQEMLSTSSTLAETTLDTENLSLIDKIVTSQVNDSLNIFSTNTDNFTTPAEVKNEPVVSSNVNVDSLNSLLSSQTKNDGHNNFATLSTSPPLSETTVIFVTNQLNDTIDAVSSSTVGSTAIATTKSKNVIPTSNDIKNATKLSVVTKKSLQSDNADKNFSFYTSTTLPETIVDTVKAVNIAPFEELVTTQSSNTIDSASNSFILPVGATDKDKIVISTANIILDPLEALLANKSASQTENLSQFEYLTMSSQPMLETTLDAVTISPIDIIITSQLNDTDTAFTADHLTQTKSPIGTTKLSANEIISSMTKNNLTSDSLSTLKEPTDDTITISQNDLNEMQGQLETRSSPAVTPDTIQMVSSGNIIFTNSYMTRVDTTTPLPITQSKVKEEHVTTKPVVEVTDNLIGSFKIDSANDTMPIERIITSTVASFLTKYSSESTVESETKIQFSAESLADSIGTHTTYTRPLFLSTLPTPVENIDNGHHENAISITSSEQIVHINDSSIISSKPSTFEQKFTAGGTTDDVIFKTESLNTALSHNESLSSSLALSETTVDPDNVSPIDIFATGQISSNIDKSAPTSISKIHDTVNSGMSDNKITIDTNLFSTSGPNTFANALEPLDAPAIMIKVVSPKPTTINNAFEPLVTLANVKMADFDNQLQNERIINNTTPARNIMEVNPKLQTSESVIPIATEVSYTSTVASLQQINHNVFTTAVEASASTDNIANNTSYMNDNTTVEGTKYSSVNAEKIFNQKSTVFNQRLPLNSVSRKDVRPKVVVVNTANTGSETLSSTFSTRSIENEILRNPTAGSAVQSTTSTRNPIIMDNIYNKGQTKTQDKETRNLQNLVLNASDSEVKNLVPVTITAPSNLPTRYDNVRKVTESSQTNFLFSAVSEVMKESLPYDTSLLNEKNKDIPTQTLMQKERRTSDAIVLKKDLGEVPLDAPEVKINLPSLVQPDSSSPRLNNLKENKYEITTEMGYIISIPRNVISNEPATKTKNSEINQTSDITTEQYSKSSVLESILEAETSIVNEVAIQSTAMPTDTGQKLTQDYELTQQNILNLGLTTQNSPDLDKVTTINKISDVQIVSIDMEPLNTHSGLIIPNKKSSLREKNNLRFKQNLESDSVQNSAIRKGIANIPSKDESVTEENIETEQLPRDESTTGETITKQLSKVTKIATESATRTESMSEQNNLADIKTPKGNDTKEINIPTFIDISTKSKRKNKTLTRGQYNTTDISNIQSSTTRYPPQTIPSLNVNNKAKLPALDSSKKEPNKFVCQQNVRGRFSDSEHCRKFYICIGRPEPVEGLCPNNTVFSDLRKQCTRNLSHCIRNNQFQCVTQGRFSDFLIDNTYYICVKNKLNSYTRFKLQCQNGYHLNKKSVRCVLNNNVLSQLILMSDTSKSNSDQSISSTKKAIKKVNKSKSTFKCKKEGKFADPSDCRRYFMCIENEGSNYWVKRKKCDSDEIFHKDMGKCVDAESYECK